MTAEKNTGAEIIDFCERKSGRDAIRALEDLGAILKNKAIETRRKAIEAGIDFETGQKTYVKEGITCTEKWHVDIYSTQVYREELSFTLPSGVECTQFFNSEGDIIRIRYSKDNIDVFITARGNNFLRKKDQSRFGITTYTHFFYPHLLAKKPSSIITFRNNTHNHIIFVGTDYNADGKNEEEIHTVRDKHGFILSEKIIKFDDNGNQIAEESPTFR